LIVARRSPRRYSLFLLELSNRFFVVLESIWLVMKNKAEGCSYASGYFRAWLISSLCAVRDRLHLNVVTYDLGNVANLDSKRCDHRTHAARDEKGDRNPSAVERRLRHFIFFTTAPRYRSPQNSFIISEV